MMQLMPGVDASASALNAEKVRMNLIAQNIANSQTTRDVDGGVYKRKVVAFEQVLDSAKSGEAGLSRVRIGSIQDDSAPTRFIYNPDHPDANNQGMVEMPNVDVSREMVDLITASRSYEANLQVVKNARQMVQKTLAIGR
jgi:flagellar basal-body rod protein FlgC